MHRFRNARSVSICLALAAILSFLSSPAFANDPVVTKIFTVDSTGADVAAEITNTGTVNAENRLFRNDRMPAETKTLAMGEVFTGAAESGMLVRTTLVSGDLFFAIDSTTGNVIVVEYRSTEFALPPTSTGFTRWVLPGGVR